MYSRSNNGITKPIIFAVALVIIIALTIWAVTQIRTPTLVVSNVSLNPTTINVNGHATLNFTIKNNDASNQHNITVTFNVTSVTFYINNIVLVRDNSGVQYYNIQLQSSEQSTYSFKVTGILTGGASTSTYQILLNFFDENSTRFDTETASLTINQ
jgi:Tfp pilus assembly protein PilX